MPFFFLYPNLPQTEVLQTNTLLDCVHISPGFVAYFFPFSVAIFFICDRIRFICFSLLSILGFFPFPFLLIQCFFLTKRSICFQKSKLYEKVMLRSTSLVFPAFPPVLQVTSFIVYWFTSYFC